jgi:hypothetical protein
MAMEGATRKRGRPTAKTSRAAFKLSQLQSTSWSSLALPVPPGGAWWVPSTQPTGYDPLSRHATAVESSLVLRAYGTPCRGRATYRCIHPDYMYW